MLTVMSDDDKMRTTTVDDGDDGDDDDDDDDDEDEDDDDDDEEEEEEDVFVRVCVRLFVCLFVCICWGRECCLTSFCWMSLIACGATLPRFRYFVANFCIIIYLVHPCSALDSFRQRQNIIYPFTAGHGLCKWHDGGVLCRAGNGTFETDAWNVR